MRRVRAFADRAAHLRVLLRARRRWWAPGLAALALAAVTVSAGAVWVFRPPRKPALAAQQDTWRFLLVCRKCGHRAHTAARPDATLARKNGLLQCPKCNQFAATSYRRGGQVVPPGGW